MNYSSYSSNFYSGLLEWDGVKSLTITTNFLTISFGLPLLYFVAWYEQYSADLMYRSLINQLLSHLCYIEIAGCLVSRISYFTNFCFSPLPLPVCDGAMFVGRLTFMTMLTEIAMRQLIKYLYIFNWKNIVSLNDNFFAIFMTISNIYFSTIFIFVTYFLGFHNEELGNYTLSSLYADVALN